MAIGSEMQEKPGGMRDALYKLWRKFRSAYSTTEMRTGQVWIDGREIYRKVVVTGALPNATTKNVAHGIVALDEVISVNGMADNATVQRPLPYADATATDIVELDVSDTNITLRSTGDQSGFTASFVIVEYVK